MEAKKKSIAKKKPAAKKAAANTSKITAAPVASKGKTPVATSTKSPFSKKFLDQQREALLEERARYTQHSEFLLAEAATLAREREPGDAQFDEESGEGDSIAVERDRDLQLSAQAQDAIDQIDGALARWDAGTYGICIASGEPIPEERLEAIPFADMKVEFKSRGTTWR
ncbi:MAG: RNA polymerase-binding transcription factor DksA [Candidatus Poriferisodalaceae bacterium]|jgi:RNA polymerase-binding transcription factor DksA